MTPQLWPGGPGDGGSDLGQVSWSGECVLNTGIGECMCSSEHIMVASHTSESREGGRGGRGEKGKVEGREGRELDR